MAKKWAEVEASPAYQSLPSEDQEAARNQYFADVVAPQVSTSDLTSARSQFDSDTAPTMLGTATRVVKNIGTKGIGPVSSDIANSIGEAVGIDSLASKASDSINAVKSGVGSLYSQVGTVLDDPAAFGKMALTSIGDVAVTGYPRLVSAANKWAGGSGELPLGIEKGAQSLHEEFTPAYDKYGRELAQSRKEADSSGNKSSELRAVGNLMQQDAQSDLSPAAQARNAEYDKAHGIDSLGFLATHPGKALDMTLENLPSQGPLLATGYAGGALMRSIAGKAAATAEATALKEAALSPAVRTAQMIGNPAQKAAAEAGMRTAATKAGQVAADSAIADASPYLTALNIGGESSMTVAQAADAIHQSVQKAKPENLASLPLYQQYLTETGNDKDARALLAGRLTAEWAPVAGMGTTFGSLVTGGARAEAMALAGQVSGYKQAAKGVGKEMLEEAIQNPLEDLAQHQAQIQVDPTDTYDPIKSAVEGAVVSMGHSGAVQFAKPIKDSVRSYLSKGPAQDDGSVPGVPPGASPAPTGDVSAADVLGTPAAAPTVADKALYTPKPLTALDRVDEINGKLETPDIAPAEKDALRAERDGITETWPAAVHGAPTSFTTESGSRLDGQYALMEAGDLTTSHDESLRPTPTYPAELQPRERERHASEMQVQQIVQRLDPARLGESADVATGAPIVGADGLVESGNARTIALKRVYQANGQKAENYKQYLKDNADRFGLTPEAIDAMQKPVLVRVRQTPVNRAEFARQANASTVAQMSPSETARSDAARIDSMDDLNPDESGDFTSGASSNFVRRFMAKLPGTEQGGMMDESGRLSQSGYTRIRNAVLAKAYGDSPVLQRMVESLDDSQRNISKALIRVAPDVAKMRESIGEGALHDVDITPDLMAAVSEMADLRDKGTSVEQGLAQMGMFGEKLSPESRMLLGFLNDNTRSPRRIAEFIQNYIDALTAAGNPGQGSMFGDNTAPSKSDLMTAARRTSDATTATRSADAGNAKPDQANRGQPENAPGDQAGDGGDEAARRAAADQQWGEALSDLGAIVRDHAGVARMLPEDTPNLMPTLVKLFEVGIEKVGYNIKDLMAHIKAALKAIPEFKKFWNKIDNATYRKAAMQAIANAEKAPGNDLFSQPAPHGDLFAGAGKEIAEAKNPAGIPENWKLADNKKEWIDEHGYIRGLAMSDKERAVEQALYDQIRTDQDGLIEKYLTQVLKPHEGKLVDPDRVKELSDEFKSDRSLAHAVHEPSSHLSKVIFDRLLRENIDKPVIFTAGGGGSGKTEAMPHAFKAADIKDFDGVVFDSTLSAFDSARKKIDSVLRDGGKAVIVYTNSPMEKAFNFAMGRPRVVPITVLAHAHKGASDTSRRLAEHYKGNPDVRLIFVNNFGGIPDIHVGSIAEVPNYDYNQSVEKLYEIAKEARNEGRITEERYQALVVGISGGTVPVRQAGSIRGADEAGGVQQVHRASGRDEGETGGLNGQDRNDGPGGTQGKEPGAAPATGRDGQTADVPGGPVGTDQRPDRDADNGTGGQAGARQGEEPAGGRGDSESVRGDGDGNRPVRNAGIPAGRDIPAKTGRNYAFGDGDLTYAGSWQVKARQNVEAVELLKKLQADGRQATREEQATLAKFIGWGSSEIANSIFGDKLDKQLSAIKDYDAAMEYMERSPYGLRQRESGYYQAFQVLAAKDPKTYGQHSYYSLDRITKDMLEKARPDASVKRWGDLRDRLKAAMTVDEWDAASRSTQYAHYTSKPVVKALLGAVSKMGFKGGTILEPGAGIGVFPGLMSSDVANNSIYTGIEFDPITGGILKQLFPDERILVESFIDSKLPENFYDVAFGNPPFGAFKVLADPKYVKHAFALHDYFFAKSLDSVKPGGLLVFVTSRYTMDKKGDKARAYMAERADLVGAIRLPQTAFQKNAGTEVVTDILFLRKKVPGQTFDQAQPWLGLGEVQTDKAPALVNEYFAAHPEMVMGTHARAGKMYSKDEYTVLPNGGDIEAQIVAAVENLPADVFVAGRGSAAEAAKVREMDFDPKAKKEGSFYVSEAGVLMQREGGVGVRADAKYQKDAEVLKDYVSLRDAVKQSQIDQLNDGDWESSLKVLQKAYAAFQKKHGRLLQNTTYMQRVKVEELDEDGVPTGNKIDDEEQRRRFPLLAKIKGDTEWTLVAELERLNEDTGEVTDSKWLTERTLNKPAAAEVRTPADALLATLDESGTIDMAAVAKRIGLNEQETIDSLGTLVYEDPAQGWVMADEYLSGNVKKKLAAAEEAAKSDKSYARNVEALKSVQPAPRSPEQITPQIGMNWIPGEVYEQFLADVTGVKAKIEYIKRTRDWVLTTISGEGSARATADWGAGDKADAGWLMEKALTGAAIRLNKSVSDGKGGSKQVFDPDRTEAANQKRADLRKKFQEWLFQDAKRTTELVQLYNDKFNTTVQRKFDGAHLSLPGTSKLFNIFDHVKRGAWRVIQTGNTYLAHAVGSGKTFEMVISAMEQKRLGKIKKPMIIVPGHMLQQFASEWQQLYPTARLMVADEENFHTENRRRFVSRVAMSDLDGVIMTHSSFGLLDLDPVFKQKMIEQELEVLRASYVEAGGDLDDIGEKKGKKDPKIKRIESQIEKLEQQLAKAMSSDGKDKNVRFDEMGVDMLYVDEAHLFRKLSFATARQTKGIDPQGSQMAWDLYMKTRWLAEKNPTRNLVMASGTAITNTTAELYTVQRFMAPQVLEENGLAGFDDWASQFGEESTSIESTASGKYEPVTRFQNFVNVGEMTQMFRDFADVLNEDHLAALLGDKRPKVAGGSRKMVITPKTDTYTRFLKEDLAPRIEASRKWKPSFEQQFNPDPIIAINIDARLAAIDMRFMEPSLPNDPDSKLNKLIDGVIRIYKETENNEYRVKSTKDAEGNEVLGDWEPIKGATQMVFFESGFGKMVAQRRGFNARAWMEKRLRDAGIPASQIAFMEDYKKSSAKLKLFADVNKGKVRVLVGSSAAMGTGVNAQQRLVALHHLDAPYVPAILEQREGRIVRQGNKNPEVQIYAYSTFGSFDENLWQMLARKKFFIEQAMSGDPNIRSIEDVGEVNQLQMAAGLVAENPFVMQHAGAKADVDKMTRLYRNHEDQRAKHRSDYESSGRTIAYNEKWLPDQEKAAARVKDLRGDLFTGKADGKDFATRKDWGSAILAKYKDLADKLTEKSTKIGELSGFDVMFDGERNDTEYRTAARLMTPVPTPIAFDPSMDPVGMAMRAVNALVEVSRKPAETRKIISEAKDRRNSLESRLEAPFPLAEQLANKVKETAELEAQMLSYGAEKTGLEREQEIEDAWQARTGAITPLLSRGTGRGMALRDLQAVADRVAKSFKNLPRVHVLESPFALSTKDPSQKALRDHIRKVGAWDDVEGATHEGEIYLFASGMADEARAEHVLATHEVTHYGLRGAIGKDLDAALQHVMIGNERVRKAAVALKLKNGLASNLDAVEEVLADMPSADLAKLTGWRKLVKVVRNWLNSAGLKAMAAKLDKWLQSGLSDQEKADLYVADLVNAARDWVKRGKGQASVPGTMLAEQKLSEDWAEQEKWLDREARARGFKNIDDLAEKAYPVFEKLAALWRQKHPADALLSRKLGYPLVSGRASLEGDIAAAAKKIADSVAKGAKDSVEIGRVPHSLTLFLPNPHVMVMDANVQHKVFLGKHGEKVVGVTPEMLVNAMYRPAMIFKEGADTYNIVTNILTDLGPVMVSVKANGAWGGKAAAIILSAYPREGGAIADWINGRDRNRILIYADELQAPEVVTGRLNPENTNPAFKGRDLVPAKGGINGVEHNARAPTSPISDKPTIANPSVPVNSNYRGMATVATKLQQHLTGKGAAKIKTRADLTAWIAKHYRGEEGDRPMFSRATAPAAPVRHSQTANTATITTRFGKYRALADRTIARMDAAVNGLGELPDQAQYLAERYRTLGRIAHIDEIAGNIRKAFSTATADDKKAVYAYLTTRGATAAGVANANVRTTAEQTKKYIGTVGDQLVARGLIPESSREEYRDRYLPRLYLAHLLDDTSWRAIGGGKKASDMGYLKQRNDELPEEYRKVILGEVTDPAFLAASAIAQPMRDMAILDWLKKISGNEKWIWPKQLVEWGGRTVSAHWLQAEADALLKRSALYDNTADKKKAEAIATEMRKKALSAMAEAPREHADYKRLPDTPRYGLLRGLMVRREIYDDLVGLGSGVPGDAGWSEKLLGHGGIGTKIQQLWKTSKVALNPPGQIRNFISNAVMLQLSGVPLRKIPGLFIRAMHDIHDNGKYSKIGKKYGFTAATFTAQELYRSKRDLLELEVEIKGNHPLLAIQRVGAFVMDKAGDAYQWSEMIMKTVKMIDAMEREGLTEDMAAIEAQKWLFDYSLVNRNIRYLRNAPVGMPFLTYSAKVAPRLVDVATKHPIRFLPWVILFYGMGAAAQAMLGGSDDDWDKLKKTLPEWLRKKPHAVPLPWRDADGRVQFTDIGYFFPWSQWAELGNNVAHGEVMDAARSAGIIGGPVPDIITAMKTGIDPFTKKLIADPADPAMEQGIAVLNYAWNMAAPPFLTSNGFISPMGVFDKQYGGKLVQGVTGTTDKFGDERATTPQAIAGLLGVNIKGIDPDHSKAMELNKMVREATDTKKKLVQRLGDRSLSEAQRAALMGTYTKEMQERAKKAQKFSNDAAVPDFARPAR